jgi:hypothetical protein
MGNVIFTPLNEFLKNFRYDKKVIYMSFILICFSCPFG